MVQYKRKPIPTEPPKTFRNDAEVWVMEATGEVFGSYESYLQKLDYYQQRKFTCEITGHTNMTFFEALKSEQHGSDQVDSTFPDPLREPILRRVQFSTIGRIDDLVNALYEDFKEEFCIGERVQILLENLKDSTEKLDGTVVDKMIIGEVGYPTGSVDTPGSTRYFVALDAQPSQEALVDNKHIFRERKYFNKQVLRSFLKHTITRERWEGAPWLVKEDIARSFKIDTMIPPALQYENIMTERKALAALKRGRPDEQCLEFFQYHLPGLVQATKAYKGKLPPELVVHFQEILAGKIPPTAAPPTILLNGSLPSSEPLRKSQPAPPPPPFIVPIKYPIEDLEVAPLPYEQRPPLKYFPSEAADDTSHRTTFPDHWNRIEQKSIGSLLEIWNALNVHSEFFVLDSFIFDDFVDAMLFKVDEVECELFAETHCALLKLLVDEKGNLDPTLPSPADNGEEEDENNSAESSTVSTPAPVVPTRQSGRLKRSSLLRNDISETLRSDTNGHGTNGGPQHRADEMLAARDWITRLAARDFTAGGWQIIMVGLLHYLARSATPRFDLEPILAHLAPIDQKPSQETARRQYVSLDVNLRIIALETLMMLAVTSRTLKDSMEDRVASMTDIRKDKVSLQRDRKTIMEEIHALDEQRRALQPQVPDVSADVTMNGNSTMEKSEMKEEEESNPDSDDEGPRRGRRVNELKRKREKEEEVRKEKEKQAKLDDSVTSQYKRLTREIQKKEKDVKDCEAQVIYFEEQLRLHACHRTKVLGRDRFWNRYYWFERNGMPFGGSPTSSTADYGYANGRIWVQGPDELERLGFIDLPPDESAQYTQAFGMTVQKRREVEHGPTILNTAWDWGYYDSHEDLDQLMHWLDDRGNRERALRKELAAWRDKIMLQMDFLHKHLAQVAEKRAAADEPIVGIATRKKTYVDHNATKYPCLAWTNSAAKRQLGQLHSEGALRNPTKASKSKAQPALVEKPATRSSGRVR